MIDLMSDVCFSVLGALFLFIFLWTPPHFWALALCRADDYATVGIPMLPVVAGKAETRRQILKYSLLLVPLSFMPIVLGTAGLTYGVAVAIVGAGFLLLAFSVRSVPDDRPPRSLFRFSLLSLFFLFVSLFLVRAASLAPLASGISA